MGIVMSKRIVNISGNVYGRLIAIRCDGVTKHKKATWLCVCSCGNVLPTIVGTHLRNGNTKSCGCLRKETTCLRSLSHGKRHSPEYMTWASMMARCYNPSHKRYDDYGGRGIVVCKHWHSVINFIVDMAPKPVGLTLDRVNNEKGYFPENCRWATYTEQNRHTRRTRLLTFNGITKSVAEWAETTGLTRHLIKDRLKLGWSIERTLTTPIRCKSQ